MRLNEDERTCAELEVYHFYFMSGSANNFNFSMCRSMADIDYYLLR